jgi:hypothetical protein
MSPDEGAALRRSRRGLTALGCVLALGAASCRDTGVNPCDRPFPDVDRQLDVAPAGAVLARLRVEQQFTPGIDGGCAEAVPVRLTFVGTTPAAVSFTYRVSWSAEGGGWFRDGVVSRLAVGGRVDAGMVPDARRLDDGVLTVTVQESPVTP